MKYEIKDFQLIAAIHELGTFAKAAEHLNRTPSAITQSIQKLEDLLGFQLFDRSGYRPIITPEGQLFLQRGKQILNQIAELESDLQLIEKGFESEFNIAFDDLIAIENFFPLIQAFQKVSPRVIIRLHREVLNGCWDALLQNRATIALGASGEPPIGLPSHQKTIGEISFVFAVAKNHPLTNLPITKFPDLIPKEELIQYPSIVISDTSRSMPARSSGLLEGQPILIVPNMEAKIRAQISGLGIGYLPRNRVETFLTKGELVEINVNHQKSKTYLKAAWRTDVKSEILQWFIKELDKKKDWISNDSPNF